MKIRTVKLYICFFVIFFSFNSLVAQTHPDALKARAINFIDNGNYNEALSVLESLKTHTTDKDIYFLLGLAYQKLGQYQKSVEYFKSFESKKPETEDFHYYLGISFYELKEHKAALSEFIKSELAGVKVEESSYYVGYIYFLRDRYDDALPYFVKAIKEDGQNKILAHYYAGICLYNKGFEDRAYFDSAIYHFEKVVKEDNNLSPEARRYIEVIKEFLNEGTARHKKRLEFESKADVFFTTNRTVTPVDGLPIFGITADKNRLAADFLFDVNFSPILYNNFGVYLNYLFLLDTALSTQINYTNVQKHKPGISFQFFNQLRTYQVSVNYSYGMDFLDTDKIRRLSANHTFELSYEQSVSSSWILGFKLPFKLYKSNGGVWGDFEGKGIEFAVSSYHVFGKASLRIEPNIIIYMDSGGVIPKFNYFGLDSKFNLPWKVWVFFPSIKGAIGRISSDLVSRNTYDFSGVIGAPLGLGMRFNIFVRAREGFVTTVWETMVGMGFEFLY